jgi:hypothetical protein
MKLRDLRNRLKELEFITSGKNPEVRIRVAGDARPVGDVSWHYPHDAAAAGVDGELVVVIEAGEPDDRKAPEIWSFEALCTAVREAFDAAAAGEPVSWTGPAITWDELLVSGVPAPTCFEPESLAYHAERDRDVRDLVVMTAVHLGMEQAARMIAARPYMQPTAESFETGKKTS